nr:N-lysine methyltransferase KMT5A-like [Hydra vulgaris]XP_047134299.1 N-lysine methyltransferase KMT5A-like [Hydra vulgaris]XP_047134301.1 N-lysine methyltransferase KMT5A-like [Hydra vulgaris]
MDNIIGYGIFVKKDFYPGDVLLEYKGKLITRLEAEKAHEEYHSKNEGCFIFDVDWKNSKMSIDATYSTCLGRYINDAPERFSNCRPKTHIINGNPHLLFFSKVFIPNGTELRYDYGDRKNQNWRELKNYIQPFTMEEVRNSRYVGKVSKKKLKIFCFHLCNLFSFNLNLLGNYYYRLKYIYIYFFFY